MKPKAVMDLKQCRRCGQTKPIAAFPTKQGHICRECYNTQARIKRGRPAALPKRSCKYCGADITRTQYRRTVCDAPDCQAKWQQELYLRHQGPPKNPRPKKDPAPQKPRRKCRLCGHDIMNNNWFFCADCYENHVSFAKRRIDGDWLYV
jgi:hypothetical protein